MAKTDLRLDAYFYEHPKTQELEARLGAEGIIALQRLWCFAAVKHTRGEFIGLTPAELEIASRWRGPRGALIAALLEPTWKGAGWLEEIQGGYRLHDWEGNQTYLFHSEERSERSSQAAAAKHRKYDSAGAPPADRKKSHAKTRKPHPPYPSPLPSPSPSPFPEDSAEPADADSTQAAFSLRESTQRIDPPYGPERRAPRSAAEVPIATFPVVGRGGSEWNLSRSFAEELRTAFPALDIVTEAQKARVWVLSNPRHKKTADGMRRFLFNWMSRAQNSSGPRPAGGSAPAPAAKPGSAAWLAQIAMDSAERDREEAERGEWRARDPPEAGFLARRPDPPGQVSLFAEIPEFDDASSHDGGSA